MMNEKNREEYLTGVAVIDKLINNYLNGDEQHWKHHTNIIRQINREAQRSKSSEFKIIPSLVWLHNFIERHNTRVEYTLITQKRESNQNA